MLSLALTKEPAWFKFLPITFLFSPPLEDSELTELKDTIDILKFKNTEAQEIIQGAFSNPAITPKGIEYAAVPHIDWICSCPANENVNSNYIDFVFFSSDEQKCQ